MALRAGIQSSLRSVDADDALVAKPAIGCDLVFVLAMTQVTAYLALHLNRVGLAEALVILGLMWWAWVGYSWLSNGVNRGDLPTRLTILTAMAAQRRRTDRASP